MRTIAGIDFSIVSPGVCVFTGETFSFSGCKFYFLYKIKKFEEAARKNIRPSPYPEWKTSEQRFEKLAEWTLDKVKDCQEVYLEGYSMASKGRVFDIAEATGLLKHKLWKNKIAFKTVPPTSLKKFATGKGNARKEAMEEFFIRETNINLRKILLQTQKQISPSGDLIDSYFLAKYGFDYEKVQNPTE